MLSLQVKTRTGTDKLVDKVIAYFTETEGMGMTDLVEHHHHDNQALDVTVSNVGNPSEARSRADAISRYAQREYGYEPVRFLLHFDDTGSLGRHVVVDIQPGHPTRVSFESDQADEVVRRFANSIT